MNAPPTFRRTLTLAVSLICCALVVACWVRSYWVRDFRTWGTGHSDNVLESSAGRLIYADAQWPNLIPIRAPEIRSEPRTSIPAWLDQPEHTDGFRFLGFEYSREVFPYKMDWNASFFMPVWRIIAIPYWAPFALLAIHPLRRLLAALHRARRRRQVRCVQCGYDLRATPGRCPECGEPGYRPALATAR